MASIEKYALTNGDIRWKYTVYAGFNPVNGKRKRICKRGYKTKREAKNASVLLEEQLLNEGFVEKNTITFNELYALWRKEHKQQVKPSTYYSVGGKFNKHILPHFGELRVQNITRNYCQDFIEQLASTPINKRTSKTKRPNKMHPVVETSFKSLNEYKMYASQVFKFAVEQGFIKTNPMQHVKVPKTADCHVIDIHAETAENFWDKETALKFLKVLEEHGTEFDQVYFKLLLLTGLRKAEALGLLWEDIDFDNATLNICKTLYFECGEFKLLKPKTQKSIRTIKLESNLCSQLKELKEKQFANDYRNPNKVYVFEREYNLPVRLPYPNERLNILCEKGRLERITVHGLRHTHATLLFEAGVSIKEVQERLGHSDFKMTMDIYTHVTNKVKEETTEKLAEFLNS